MEKLLTEITNAKKNLDDWFELAHPTPILIEQAQVQLRRAISQAVEIKMENGKLTPLPGEETVERKGK